MTDDEVKASLSDFNAFWLTLWAETRGEPIEGQIGVACVIRNRVLADLGQDDKPDWWGEGYRGVCLAHRQFSCWLPLDGPENYAAVMAKARLVVGDYAERSTLPADPVVRQLKAIAASVMNGDFLDRTKGCTQYLTLRLYETKPPKWAQGHVKTITLGSQIFIKAA